MGAVTAEAAGLSSDFLRAMPYVILRCSGEEGELSHMRVGIPVSLVNAKRGQWLGVFDPPVHLIELG